MSRLQGGRSSQEQGTDPMKGCHTLHHRPRTEGDRNSREDAIFHARGGRPWRSLVNVMGSGLRGAQVDEAVERGAVFREQ